MKIKHLLIFSFLFISFHLSAQLAKTQVVRVQAIANSNGSITLTWPAEAYTGTFEIYKRTDPTIESWGSTAIASVAGSLNSYTDASVVAGQSYEYRILKKKGSTIEAYGYILAGNKKPEPQQFYSVFLVIDSNYQIPLATELNTLVNDLTKEGFIVKKIIAGRTEAVSVIKTRIVNFYNAEIVKPTSLFLLGHIPVPYSGYYSSNGDAPPPDGHVEGSGNHTGAWSTDAFYGILTNDFTDSWVNCTTGSLARNKNIIGDGKFDQTKLPAKATLEVGRVDLFDMPAFGKSDTILTRNYLNRNHLWRTASWKVRERAVIDNNFTTLNLASTGYANFSAMLGVDSVNDVLDYFVAQRNGSYLWSYGCGAGSYTSCSGIGNTNSFINDSFENVFTILSGSYFGDWDIQNNFLKAPLASKSLASFWGGIPKWYVHQMGLGERIGTGTLISQNNAGFYFTGNFNASENSMHIALMGDPTLRMRNLPPVETVSSTVNNNKATFNWSNAGSGLSYAVYLVNTSTNEYTRITTNAITDTFYTDPNVRSGKYTYAVRAIKLETTASGSYYNVGGSAFATVDFSNGITENDLNLDQIKIYPNPIQTGNTLKIKLSRTLNGKVNVCLYDINGKLIEAQSPEFSTASDELFFNQIPAQNGLYLISIEWNGQRLFSKVLVQN